ncbi:MAG: PstS family phosphate ABC transporter substrate-binding protein [Trueperaceae bacterium]|nr:PstS family phosphate ABC transporter substrate-binding protein [Trueperaceae bacterium]
MTRSSNALALALVVLVTMVSLALAQDVRIDGSSTVYPISLALSEEFQIMHPDARLTVAFSGTGAGFEKFCRGETDVSGASRPIKASEVEACAQNDVPFVELPIAADGLSVVVHPDNDFVQCLSVAELHAIWRPDSDVSQWQDVRAEWPAEDIVLYGAGTDSGTFDYFTEAVNGESGAVRTDFFPSEDDNVLVQGVSGDENAMGFFGYAYYAENTDRLSLVAIDGGSGCIEPSPETIAANTYTPLSRPLFLYFNADRLSSNDTLRTFAEFAISPDAEPLVADTGYLAYPREIYDAAADRLSARTTGTSFATFEPGDSVLDAVQQAGDE